MPCKTNNSLEAIYKRRSVISIQVLLQMGLHNPLSTTELTTERGRLSVYFYAVFPSETRFNRLLKYWFQTEKLIEMKVPDPLPALKRSLATRSTLSKISHLSPSARYFSLLKPNNEETFPCPSLRSRVAARRRIRRV